MPGIELNTAHANALCKKSLRSINSSPAKTLVSTAIEQLFLPLSSKRANNRHLCAGLHPKRHRKPPLNRRLCHRTPRHLFLTSSRLLFCSCLISSDQVPRHQEALTIADKHSAWKKVYLFIKKQQVNHNPNWKKCICDCQGLPILFTGLNIETLVGVIFLRFVSALALSEL